jgi:hypothetical protein
MVRYASQRFLVFRGISEISCFLQKTESGPGEAMASVSHQHLHQITDFEFGLGGESC